MANRLILIVPDGADSLISLLDKYMKEWENTEGNASKNASDAIRRYTEPAPAVPEWKPPVANPVGKLLRRMSVMGASNSNITSAVAAATAAAGAGATLTSTASTQSPPPLPPLSPVVNSQMNGAGASVGTGGLSNLFGSIQEDEEDGGQQSDIELGGAESASATQAPPPPQIRGSHHSHRKPTHNSNNSNPTAERVHFKHQDQQPFNQNEMERKRQEMASAADEPPPFEMHAYEALLTTVMALETQEFNRVNAQVQLILGYFRTGSLLPIELQEQMRNKKNDLAVMIRRISSARNTLNALTEDDEDMALMNLSVLKHKPKLYQ